MLLINGKFMEVFRKQLLSLCSKTREEKSSAFSLILSYVVIYLLISFLVSYCATLTFSFEEWCFAHSNGYDDERNNKSAIILEIVILWCKPALFIHKPTNQLMRIVVDGACDGAKFLKKFVYSFWDVNV